MNRAINEQTLVGNIGGYLGLFLGYSILQIPNMIQMLRVEIKEKYRHLKSGNHLKKDIETIINVKEESNKPQNFEKEHCQSENTIACMIELIQKVDKRNEARFSKIEENIANITKNINDKSFNLEKL